MHRMCQILFAYFMMVPGSGTCQCSVYSLIYYLYAKRNFDPYHCDISMYYCCVWKYTLPASDCQLDFLKISIYVSWLILISLWYGWTKYWGFNAQKLLKTKSGATSNENFPILNSTIRNTPVPVVTTILKLPYSTPPLTYILNRTMHKFVRGKNSDLRQRI